MSRFFEEQNGNENNGEIGSGQNHARGAEDGEACSSRRPASS